MKVIFFQILDNLVTKSLVSMIIHKSVFCTKQDLHDSFRLPRSYNQDFIGFQPPCCSNNISVLHIQVSCIRMVWVWSLNNNQWTKIVVVYADIYHWFDIFAFYFTVSETGTHQWYLTSRMETSPSLSRLKSKY